MACRRWAYNALSQGDHADDRLSTHRHVRGADTCDREEPQRPANLRRCARRAWHGAWRRARVDSAVRCRRRDALQGVARLVRDLPPRRRGAHAVDARTAPIRSRSSSPTSPADLSLGAVPAATFAAERIAALAFIPLVSLDRVIGKFMLYYDAPTRTAATRICSWRRSSPRRSPSPSSGRDAEEQARRSEERLRFALDAASMGTWDWDLPTNAVQWSDNLERIHGLPPGTFDGTFASYEREIHPDDRDRVLDLGPASARRRRAARRRVPHRRRPTARCDGSKARAGRVRRRHAGAHDRRLHDGHPAQGGRARAAGRGGRSEPAEGRVPGDAVARAAHAAERDPRLGPDAADTASLPPTRAAGDRRHRSQCAAPGTADRRHPRRLADHHRQAGDRARPVSRCRSSSRRRSPASLPAAAAKQIRLELQIAAGAAADRGRSRSACSRC